MILTVRPQWKKRPTGSYLWGAFFSEKNRRRKIKNFLQNCFCYRKIKPRFFENRFFVKKFFFRVQKKFFRPKKNFFGQGGGKFRLQKFFFDKKILYLFFCNKTKNAKKGRKSAKIGLEKNVFSRKKIVSFLRGGVCHFFLKKDVFFFRKCFSFCYWVSIQLFENFYFTSSESVAFVAYCWR